MREWLRTQHCLVCVAQSPRVAGKRVLRQEGPSYPAHVATTEGPRAGLVPLCPKHHRRKGEGGGPDSHHELGKNFWTHHFGKEGNADVWVQFYLNLFHAQMRKPHIADRGDGGVSNDAEPA
jgi:hypothetical protein